MQQRRELHCFATVAMSGYNPEIPESRFRASAWISYEPDSRLHGASDMDQDVDMDAPQISTLPEEETPPPQPTRTSKFRVKLLVNEAKGGSPSSNSVSRLQTSGQGE